MKLRQLDKIALLLLSERSKLQYYEIRSFSMTKELHSEAALGLVRSECEASEVPMPINVTRYLQHASVLINSNTRRLAPRERAQAHRELIKI